MEILMVFLSALAGRDRCLTPPKEGATAVTIIGTGQDPGAIFPVEAFAEACNRGWIGTDAGTGLARITRAGRAVLRRYRSRLAATKAVSSASAAPCADAARPTANPRESPLAWLASRRDADGKPLLASWEVEAGERLRADLSVARLTPRVTMSWSGIPMGARRASTAGRSHDMTDTIVAARARVTAALRSVGPEFVDILIDVCGHLRGLEDIARSEGWPRRAARLVLQKALSALARHYGIAPEQNVDRRIARRLRHWGAEDYRPSLARWRSGGDQAG